MHRNNSQTGLHMIEFRRFFVGTFILLGFITQEALSLVEDNRFLPLYPRNYSRTWCFPSAKFFDAFGMIGSEAFDQEDDEKDIGVYEIFGVFNENTLANAVVAIGLPDPFDQFMSLQKFRGQDLIWNMDGKIQSQGFAFQWDQHVWRYFWLGGSCFLMHLYARNDFELNPKTIKDLVISIDDQIRLDDLRRLMNVQLGLLPPVFNKTGFSDLDLYFRIGNIWEYLYKFRRVDAGIKFGTMVPTGVVRNVRNTASIPFGGDGHWGVYTSADFELELKEDWKVGAHARVNKRFAKTKEERMPVVGEQQLFGAVQGLARINPGFTFIFAPYARLENIREGFGLQAGYTIAHHMKDSWKDARVVQSPVVNLEENEKKSNWTAEYVTIDAFYDCARLFSPCRYSLIVSFKWDVPLRLFAAKGAVKTNRVMLGIELNY
jgi:hypothetical protein